MSKRFINIYIKYTAKKPVLFFLMVSVFLLLILYVSLTTKTNIIQTYDGTLTENAIVINAKIEAAPDSVYVYGNRNEAVYLINVEKIETDNNRTVLFIDSDIGLNGVEDISLDIPVGEISLFERIFVRGGKAYG